MNQQLLSPEHTHIFDTNPYRMEMCCDTWPGVHAHTSARACVLDADVILLSVKPQQMVALLDEIAPSVPSTSLIVSIAAGIPIGLLEKHLPTASIVRSMPNTPAMVGEGMTVWMPTEGCSEVQLGQAKRLLSCFGDECRVAEEGYLDMATALVGSGPAYVFMLMEAMIDTGVHMGFPRDVATKLVTKTVEGSVKYSEQSNKHIAELRNDITSPGGTTAAAIYTSDQGRLRTTISDSIWSAYRRSLELGGKKSNVGPGRWTPG